MTGGRHWSSASSWWAPAASTRSTGAFPDQPDPARAAGPRLLKRRGLVRHSAGPDGQRSLHANPRGAGPATPSSGRSGTGPPSGPSATPRTRHDGLSLMWRLHQHAITARLPQQRTVLHMTLTGAGAAEGWLEHRPRHDHRMQGQPRLRCRPGHRGQHRPDAAVADRPGPIPGPGGQRPSPPTRA